MDTTVKQHVDFSKVVVVCSLQRRHCELVHFQGGRNVALATEYDCTQDMKLVLLSMRIQKKCHTQ